jgi:hypothetical protein
MYYRPARDITTPAYGGANDTEALPTGQLKRI